MQESKALLGINEELIFSKGKLELCGIPQNFTIGGLKNMQLSELRPFSKKVDVTIKVLGKNEVREVSSKLDNSTHKVTEANVGDASGVILLTLWDETIDKVEEGKTYKISNGYTSLFQNKLRLNIGRYGTIEESTDDVGEINESNNLSEKEFESRPRFGGGGGRFSGGGGRGGGGRFGNRGGGGRFGRNNYRSGGGGNYGRNRSEEGDSFESDSGGEGY